MQLSVAGVTIRGVLVFSCSEKEPSEGSSNDEGWISADGNGKFHDGTESATSRVLVSLRPHSLVLSRLD